MNTVERFSAVFWGVPHSSILSVRLWGSVHTTTTIIFPKEAAIMQSGFLYYSHGTETQTNIAKEYPHRFQFLLLLIIGMCVQECVCVCYINSKFSSNLKMDIS